MSSEPSVDDASPALAHAKRIGVDVEDLVIEAVDELERAEDQQAHHDAETVALITPSSVDGLTLGSIPLVETETEVEIKAARLRTESAGTPRGRWFFKGRDDGQHAALLDSAAMYLLAVYDEDDEDEREVVAMVLLPATIVDDLLRGRWYDSHRCEGKVAKLTWSALVDPDQLGGSAE